MDISTLESTARSLEISASSWSSWLSFWTVLVVIGLVLEYWHPIIEAWKARLFNFTKLSEIAGGLMITIGVFGELWVQYRASSVEGKLRSISHTIEGELTDRAARVTAETETLRTKNLNLERAISPRIIDQGQMGRSLQPFAGTIVRTSAVLDFEARRFGATLRVGLGMARWNAPAVQASSLDFRDGVTVIYSDPHFIRQEIPYSELAFAAFTKGKAAAGALIETLKHDNSAANAMPFVPDVFCKQWGVCTRPAPGDLLILIGAKPIDPEIERARIEEFRKRDPRGNVFLNNE